MRAFGFLHGIGLKRRAALGAALAAVPVPANSEFIAFGDSRVEFGLSGTTTPAYKASTQARSFPSWIEARAGGRVRFGRFPNFGISGNDTSQMVANPRQDATGAVTAANWYRGINSSANKGLADAQAHPAGLWVFMGGTNDGLRGIDRYTTSRANILAVIAAAAAAGKVVLLANDLPRGLNSSGAPENGGGGQSLYDFSRWILTLDCQSGGADAKPNVIACNTYDAIYDFESGANYLNLLGTLRDGLHLDVPGAKMVGEVYAAGIARVLTATPYLALLPAANDLNWVNSNPTLLTAGNGVVGGTFGVAPLAADVPAGWRLDAQGGSTSAFTVTSSKSQLDGDGYPRWIVTFSGTLAAGSNALFKLEQLLINAAAVTARISAGGFAYTDKLRAIGRCGLSTGSVGLETLALILHYADATANKSQTAEVNGAQASHSYDAGPLDAAFPVSLWQSQLLDLQEPNLVAEGRGAASGSQIYVRWNVGFNNPTAAALACQATIEVSRTGGARVAA